jgi:MoxR-like ATPase
MIFQITADPIDRYKPGPSLLAAINTALLLKRPLLLSGEPGTGKTDCAEFISRRLQVLYPDHFKAENSIRFNTKSISQSSDLFYQYDAVSHFGDKRNLTREHFFSFSSLGLAILKTLPPDDNFLSFRNYSSAVLPGKMPSGSVVLIDEIDKAPRDFPNDLLAELEQPPFCFSIKELDDTKFTQNKDFPIVVIITSNNEKGLPEAFLRRCIFHYIDPPTEAQLLDIIQSKPVFSTLNIPEKNTLSKVIKLFFQMRQDAISKPPATSELIDWIVCLKHNELLTKDIDNWKTADPAYREKLKSSLAAVVKSKADLDMYKS